MTAADPLAGVPDSATDPRDFLLEVYAMAKLQIEIAERAVQIGDMTLVEISQRRLVAYLRAAHATIEEMKGGEHDGKRPV